MNDLPLASPLLQHDSAPIEKSWTIIEMEGCNGDGAGDLDMQVARLDVHVRTLRSSGTNTFENLPKTFFEFRATISTEGKFARVEDRGIVRERPAEAIPVKIVKCLNESRERLAHLGVWAT